MGMLSPHEDDFSLRVRAEDCGKGLIEVGMDLERLPWAKLEGRWAVYTE